MKEALLTLVFVAAAALFAFDLVRGLMTGEMRFRLRYNLQATASRASDPRGFWAHAAFNVGSIAFAMIGMVRTLHGS